MTRTEQHIKYVEFMLRAKGIRINFKDLITWASGIKSPIYFDNRLSLFSFAIRNMIYDWIAEHIRQNNIKCDAIFAAPTAGLHIGASVAQKLNVPFVMIKDGKTYAVKHKEIVLKIEPEDFDLIIGLNPDSIPWGIKIANDLEKPFAYVRPQKKHGLKNNIEGYIEGQNAVVIDFFISEESTNDAISVLNEKSIFIKSLQNGSAKVLLEPINLAGKHVPVLEDLFSTVGSAGEKVFELRKYGAVVDRTIGIFDYDLAIANENIKKLGIQKSAFITAEQFIDIAQEIRQDFKKQRSEIDGFLADPWKFTEKEKSLT